MDHVHIVRWLEFFKPEIIELFIINRQHWSLFQGLLSRECLQKIKDEAEQIEIGENGENIDQLRSVGQRLWTELIQTVNTPNLFPKMCEFVKEANSDFCNFINHQGISEARLTKLLSTLSKIEPYISTEKALEYLCSYSAKMASVLHPIKKRWLSDNEIDEATAQRLMLRNLPFFGQHATEHLVYTVWKDGTEEVKKMIETMFPRFAQVYDVILTNECKPNRLTVHVGISVSGAFDLLHNKSDPLDCVSVPRVCKLSGIVDVSKELPLNLRSYQKELAEQAVTGLNVLICAPTNSGKTLVSVHIMRERYYASLESGCVSSESGDTSGPKFKAAFIVPTRALVEQQANVLEKYFGQRLKVERLMGTTTGVSKPQMFTIRSADIVVLTPQLLLNALKYSAATGSEKVSISDFTFIVFDEAHRADENHPYNDILRVYHDTKLTSNKKMPQIVSLTASIGTGDAKDIRAIVAHYAKICANLDAKHIGHVRKNLAELRKHTPITPDTIIRCDEGDNLFYMKLKELKHKFEEKVISLFSNDCFEKLRRRLEEALDIGKLDTDLYSSIMQVSHQLDGEQVIPDPVRQEAKHLLDCLISINNSARGVRLFDKNTAIKLFEKHQRDVASMKFNEYVGTMNNALAYLRSLPDFKSMMLTKLVDLINGEFYKDTNMRCLVFTKEREHCSELADLITKYTDKQARYFTGAASAENKGLNENQQRKTLDEFRDGRIPILCATSVADEGLDIAQCKLVIKFNYVTNCIAHIQRRGRGRSKNTQSILLAENSFIHSQEEINMKKEQMMREALALIDEDVPGFLLQIEEQLQKNKEDREKKRLERLERKQSPSNNSIFVMACRRCNGFIARSTDIYLLHSQFYVVADRLIWERVKVCPLSEIERPESHTPGIGKLIDGDQVHCTNYSETLKGCCNSKLGSVIVYREGAGVRFPIFKCTQVVFINAGIGFAGNYTPDGKRHVYSQWKKVIENLFQLEDISEYEVAKMSDVQPLCQFNQEVNQMIQKFKDGSIGNI